MQAKNRWMWSSLVLAALTLTSCPARTPTESPVSAAVLAVALAPLTLDAVVIDLRVHRIATKLAIGGTPSGLAVLPAARQVLVANDTTNTIRAFVQRDITTYAALGDISVGRGPRRMTVNPLRQEVLVAVTGDPRVAVLDVANRYDRPSLKGLAAMSEPPVAVAASSDGESLAAATLSQPYRIARGAGNAFTATPIALPVGQDRRLSDLAIWGDRLIVSDITSGDLLVAAPDGTTQTIALNRDGKGAQPNRIIGNAQGTKLYVACPGTNTIAVVDPATRTVLRHVDLGPGASVPVGLAITPTGDKLYVTTDVGRQLVVIETGPALATTEQIAKSLGLSPSPGELVPLTDIQIPSD